MITKLPWKVFYTKITHNPSIMGIGDSEGVGITDSKGMMWGDPEEAKANAEFICLAVNSHEALVEALVQIKKVIDHDISYHAECSHKAPTSRSRRDHSERGAQMSHFKKVFEAITKQALSNATGKNDDSTY